MKRLYIPKTDKTEIILDPNNLYYLTKTLRFKGEEPINVFDGENEYQAYYKDKKIIIQNKIKEKEETFLKLAIAEIQKERLEWTIEKCTELGVKDFFILKTNRAQKEYKFERMNKIIISACQQSGRISIPSIQQINLSDFINSANKSEWCFCSLNSKQTKIDSNINGSIIGPEGGWTPEEEFALSRNFPSIFLSLNTLRTETAAITATNFIYCAKF